MYDDNAKGAWSVLEVCHLFADSIVFEQLISCSFIPEDRCGGK